MAVQGFAPVQGFGDIVIDIGTFSANEKVLMMSRELLRAILRGDLLKLDLLVAQGAALHDIKEKEKWSLLHRALLSVAMPPSREVVQRLISLGLGVNVVDAYGNTPIHYASRLNRRDLISVLLEAGACVNVANFEGITPLRQALLQRPYSRDCVSLLLGAGADVNQRVGDGASVRELAVIVASDDPAILRLFGA